MRIHRERENVLTVTVTSQELAAVFAAARMALDAIRTAPEPPPAAALELLEHVIHDYDTARARLSRDTPPDG